MLLPSFVIFFIAGVAETNRAPFDLVEAESEIVGGYHTEYSGFRFALFFLAEYINMFNISAIAVTLFLGGWLGPDFGLPAAVAWLMPIFWFLLKTYASAVRVRVDPGHLPRMRYDQLMTFGWKRLIPLIAAVARVVDRCHRRPPIGMPVVVRSHGLLISDAMLGPLPALRDVPADVQAAGHDRSTARRSGSSRSASTAATCSTATPTAWRSASAASCAPGCARPAASTCAGKDNPPDAPVSPGERYGFVYEINMLRCIFCAMCVEACPTEAITMTHLFEMSVTNRDDAIYTRDELLMNPDGTLPHPQPDGPLIDLNELQDWPTAGCGPPLRPAGPPTRAWRRGPRPRPPACAAGDRPVGRRSVAANPGAAVEDAAERIAEGDDA